MTRLCVVPEEKKNVWDTNKKKFAFTLLKDSVER